MSANYWQGQTIRLRAVEPSDAETFYTWNEDSERGRALDFLWPPLSMASVQAWVADQALRQMTEDRFVWIIENLEGVAVGTIDTHHCDRRYGTFSYGIAIAPEHRHHGYASEAITLILRYYFEELRYQKVTVSVYSYNTPSIRLHERLGFTLEGTHRRMGFTHGAYFDHLWYGMTVEEFAQAHPPPCSRASPSSTIQTDL